MILPLFQHDPPVLSLPLATEDKYAALARVEQGASVDFQEAARAALLKVLAAQPTFLVDDVWAAMGPELPHTSDKRAMGAILTHAQRLGLIRATGEYRASAQRQCHANPRQVWTRGDRWRR